MAAADVKFTDEFETSWSRYWSHARIKSNKAFAEYASVVFPTNIGNYSSS